MLGQDIELTMYLIGWKEGKKAFQELMSLVHDELRVIARSQLRRERANHTLRTDALVNEAYIRLHSSSLKFTDRLHFFGIASNAMRQILIDYAREQNTEKRGGKCDRVHVEDLDQLTQDKDVEVLQLNEAIEYLARFDKRKARIVIMRYFGGLTIEEVAKVLNSSPATVKRDWHFARSVLKRYMFGVPEAVQCQVPKEILYI